MTRITDQFTFVRDFEVKGRIIDDRVIALDYRIMDEFYTRTIDTGDATIRHALVRLGWTPPIVTDRCGLNRRPLIAPDAHDIERKGMERYNASFGDDVPLTPWRDLKPEQRIVWMQEASE